MLVELPEILDIPKKLRRIVLGDFNHFRFFLIHGGRGGGKSQSIARIILYLCEKRRISVCCGRETQKTIEDSVYKIFVQLIRNYELNFKIFKDRIISCTTGSTIIFKGFRETGRVNIKGLEDIDLLWIDEAEAITEETLSIIVPTIRKKNSKLFFTMNRKKRRDAVYQEMHSKENCLTIKINYYDNHHCPKEFIQEALECKEKNYAKYLHVYEGNPEDDSELMLFSASKLDIVRNLKFDEDYFEPFSSMAVDLSGAGGDFCECSIIKQRSVSKFNVEDIIEWKNADTDYTVGKIINLYRMYEPNLLTLDADGMGYPIYVSVKKAIENCIAFHGAGKSNRENCANQRADGYLTLKEYVDNAILGIPQDKCRNQLEYIEKDYQKNGGKIIIISKKDMRDKYGESPDCADSVMMNIHSIEYKRYLSTSRKIEPYERTGFSLNDYEVYD